MIKEQIANIHSANFKIPSANIEDIDQILKDMSIKKSPGPDLLLPELVKHVATIINEPLTNIVNEMI